MPRYFLEVSYKGTRYSGFQLQQNAHTIQAEVENAFRVLQKHSVSMTGSSRTDAGVHALQNFFHFDYEFEIHPQFMYKINAILPDDIVIKSIKMVHGEAHCRFDAKSREYKYYIYQKKNPFIKEQAYYFPYKLDLDKMKEGAAIIKDYADFTSFSKRNTQVKTFECNILKSEWIIKNQQLIYNVEANRFLRGMVRALTATMLLLGRKKISIEDFKNIIEEKNNRAANFATPAHGLFLVSVKY